MRLEASRIVAASMSKTRQERQASRLEAALNEMPASLQLLMKYGATDYSNYLAALTMIQMQGGVFGAVADSAAFLKALEAL